MTKFEIGKTYQTRSVCDYNCIIAITVAKRTASTITTTEGKTLWISKKLSGYNGAETVQPWGSYSMSPAIHA